MDLVTIMLQSQLALIADPGAKRWRMLEPGRMVHLSIRRGREQIQLISGEVLQIEGTGATARLTLRVTDREGKFTEQVFQLPSSDILSLRVEIPDTNDVDEDGVTIPEDLGTQISSIARSATTNLDRANESLIASLEKLAGVLHGNR